MKKIENNLEKNAGDITVLSQEEKEKYSKFVWSCGCITIMDGNCFTIYPCSNKCPIIARGKQVAEYYGISSIEIISKYQKPLLELQKGMEFPMGIMESFNKNSRFCKQCSGCHGCR